MYDIVVLNNMRMANLKVVFKKMFIAIGLAILVTAGYAFAAAKIPLFQILRESTTDILIQQRCRFSSPPKIIKDITIVTIDEESLQRLRQRWPISRGIYAAFLKRLSSVETKPLAIGMDLFFSGPSERPEDDALLAEAMNRSANSVIVSYVNDAGAIIAPEKMLAKSASGVGFVSAPRDHDLVIRETYPFMNLAGGGLIYSFPLVVYAESRGIDLDRAFYRAIDERLVIPDVNGRGNIRRIPLDPVRKTMRINYFAAIEDFKTIPLWKALTSPGAEDLFKDKIVLVGTVIEIHHDVYPTPLGITPGVIINANIMLNFMSERWLVLFPLWMMFIILLAGALAASGVTYRFGILKGAAASACLIGGAFLLASVCMQHDRIFDLFGFALIVTLSFIGASIWMSLSTLIENTQLSRLAMTDGLTGTFTYRYFELILEREAALALGKGARLSLALFDIDDFKKINDTCGHGPGNDVLRGVAAAIKDRIPSPGIVARFGGDEFVAVLPGVRSKEAYAIVSGIIEAARTLAFVWLPKGSMITMSAGLVTIECSPGSAGKDLVKAADAELYKAKASGKNRVSAV